MAKDVIKGNTRNMEVGSVTVNKSAIADLVRIKDKFDSVIESIELMGNKEFMDSYKRAKEQVKKREFDNLVY